jgi:allantoicase
MYPDGGVARLRVHGDVVADPRFLTAGAVDLAALDNGGTVVGCSNMFYSSPANLISPGLARVMGEGWETARRRDDGNDWVEFRLAGPGTVRLAELDTSYFVGNAPGWASLRGVDVRKSGAGGSAGGSAGGDADWVDLLPRVRLQPDTRHRFRLGGAEPREVTHVRLDVYPDGGMARVRLFGDLSAEGRAELVLRWLNLLPVGQAREVLVADGGIAEAAAEKLVVARPLANLHDLPESVRRALGVAV